MLAIPGKKSATADPPLRLAATALLAERSAETIGDLVAGIRATASRLADGKAGDLALTSVVQELLALAASASDHRDRLLAFARQSAVRPERLDLASLVGCAAPRLRALVGRHVGLSLPARPGVHVVADPQALEQVLLNLVANARDAIGGGPGHVAIRLEAFEVGAAPPAALSFLWPGRYALLSVADDGPGVPEALRARIFEPGFTTRPGAAGFGLSTAYGLAKQAGGYLLLAPSARRGACFTLALPLAAEAGAAGRETDAGSGVHPFLSPFVPLSREPIGVAGAGNWNGSRKGARSGTGPDRQGIRQGLGNAAGKPRSP
jgi:signal transduction histidine kinase